jgi:cytochrome oxidase Cu insertion factor (SCO1/SenC/PrrC family)
VKRLFAALLFALCATTLRSNVVDLAPQRGRTIPSIHWTDESGRARQLSEFSGYPLVLLPIYTRCPGPCLQNVARLKAALVDTSSNPRQFRILLFSFDPSDNVTSLARYRERENVPLGWSIGSASQNEIDALLEAIGVQVGKAGKEFTHPNIVLFVDPKLRIAKWIYGTAYTGHDVDLALKAAAGESDWIGQHAQLLYSLLLFAGSALCVALAYYLMQLRSLRRSSHDHSAIRPLTADR